MSQLSLSQKIAQMIVTGIHGAELAPQTASLISDVGVGGIVYLGGNAADLESVRAFSQALMAQAATSPPTIPLLIAIDHEGGRVFRFTSGATLFPDLMAIGATGNTSNAYRAGLASAQELRYAGINVSLGPDLDVSANPANPVIGTRSFGDDPQAVAEMGVAYLRGLEQGGVMGVGKHFPGHGDVAVDSHVSLPTIDKSFESLSATDLLPFRAAIQNGLSSMMMGHLAIPALDPSGLPASLSPSVIQDFLRGRLGFDEGLVWTDAMEMGAISRNFNPQDAYLRAVLAGNDILLIREPGSAFDSRDALLDAVGAGLIPEERINQSVRRILAAKLKSGLFSSSQSPPLPDFAANQALALDMSRQAVTLLLADDPSDQDQDGAAAPSTISTPPGTGGRTTAPASVAGVPPLLSDEVGRVLLVTPSLLNPGTVIGDNLTLLGEILRERALDLQELIYDPRDENDMVAIAQKLTGQAPGYPAIVVITWSGYLDWARSGSVGQQSLVNAAAQSGVPYIVVAIREPYDYLLFPESPVFLATYGSTPNQLHALAGALFGDPYPRGVLPVKLTAP